MKITKIRTKGGEFDVLLTLTISAEQGPHHCGPCSRTLLTINSEIKTKTYNSNDKEKLTKLKLMCESKI